MKLSTRCLISASLCLLPMRARAEPVPYLVGYFGFTKALAETGVDSAVPDGVDWVSTEATLAVGWNAGLAVGIMMKSVSLELEAGYRRLSGGDYETNNGNGTLTGPEDYAVSSITLAPKLCLVIPLDVAQNRGVGWTFELGVGAAHVSFQGFPTTTSARDATLDDSAIVVFGEALTGLKVLGPDFAVTFGAQLSTFGDVQATDSAGQEVTAFGWPSVEGVVKLASLFQ